MYNIKKDNNMTTFNNKLSIFIPRVLSEWANEESIMNIFKKLDIGEVERVDFVEKQDNRYVARDCINNYIYYQAFVHFKEWSDTRISRNIQDKIFNPEQVAKIVYDDPKYWIILKNNNPMTENEVKQEKRIIELEKQNANQNKIMLSYLNRIINLETQIDELKSIYWDNKMSLMVNSFDISTPPLSPVPPPPPLVRSTNSDDFNNIFLNERMQYESDETGNYIHRPDYDDRKSYQEDNVEYYNEI